MKPLVISAAARTEMLDAAEFYEHCAGGLGRRFADAVVQAIEQVRARPRSYPAYKRTQVRRCLMRRFPYIVFFLDRQDAVWVVAVAHASRQPGYWCDRLGSPR